MTCDLAFVPGGRVYRVARLPDPWAYPDWAYVGPDGTFGNRSDDPESSYRVIYASSERVGAFIETLARFRPDPAVVAALSDIEGIDEGALQPGQVPIAWAAGRCVGRGVLEGSFADIGNSRSLAFMRGSLAARILHHELPDLDTATLRSSAPRAFTQEISRLVFECSNPGGGRAYVGLRYGSRLGDDLHNWATFEPSRPVESSVGVISLDDPDLLAALERLGLHLVG